MNVTDVFGVNPTINEYSYVDRGNLDNLLSAHLGRSEHIAIRGASKSGKSWLRQKVLGDSLVVQCRMGKSYTDLYVDALAQLNILFCPSRISENHIGGTISALGEVGSQLLARIGIKTQFSTNLKDSCEQRTIGHDINDLKYIADIILSSRRRLVIEDFHYLSIAERRRIAFDLKTLWDYGLFVIIVGIWNKNNLLLSLNNELSGRIFEISITWSCDELKRIIEKGGDYLNIDFSNSVTNCLVSNAYGNAGLLQTLLLQTLDEATIRSSLPKKRLFDDVEVVTSACMQVAEQLNPLYQAFAERVSVGIRKRKDETGIYACAMKVIIDSADSELINGLSDRTIYQRANKIQKRIQYGNMKAILNKIDALQVDKNGHGLIVTYNSMGEIGGGNVTVVDHQLLLYRKYITISWPWDDLAKSKES